MLKIEDYSFIEELVFKREGITHKCNQNDLSFIKSLNNLLNNSEFNRLGIYCRNNSLVPFLSFYIYYIFSLNALQKQFLLNAPPNDKNLQDKVGLYFNVDEAVCKLVKIKNELVTFDVYNLKSKKKKFSGQQGQLTIQLKKFLKYNAMFVSSQPSTSKLVSLDLLNKADEYEDDFHNLLLDPFDKYEDIKINLDHNKTALALVSKNQTYDLYKKFKISNTKLSNQEKEVNQTIKIKKSNSLDDYQNYCPNLIHFNNLEELEDFCKENEFFTPPFVLFEDFNLIKDFMSLDVIKNIKKLLVFFGPTELLDGTDEQMSSIEQLESCGFKFIDLNGWK